MIGFARKRLLARWLLGLAATPGFVVLLVYLRWEFVDHRLVAIHPEELYQSAAMSPGKTVETMRSLRIKTVIDLRDSEPESVAEEKFAVEEAGLAFVHLPMSAGNPRNLDMQRFLAAMNVAEKPALVHCQHGQGRSVLAGAVWRIEKHGWSNEAALAATSRLPHELQFLDPLLGRMRQFDRTSAKGRVLLEFKRGEPGLLNAPEAPN